MTFAMVAQSLELVQDQCIISSLSGQLLSEMTQSGCFHAVCSSFGDVCTGQFCLCSFANCSKGCKTPTWKGYHRYRSWYWNILQMIQTLVAFAIAEE